MHIWKGAPILSTSAGVYLYGEREEQQRVMMPLSLGDVLKLSLQDIDQQGDTLSIQNPLLVGAFSPVLSITGEFDRDLGISVDYGAISSTAQTALKWRVGVNLCFGRCGAVAASSISGLQEDELMVVNGSVFSQGGVAAAASSLELGLYQQRSKRSEKTMALYQSHRNLLQQQQSNTSSSLLAQSQLALELEEVIAQLDILTQGRYSASIGDEP